MRRFSVYKGASGFYYAEIFDPNTRARIASRSTGKRDRTEAILAANDWVENGLPSSSGARRPLAEELSATELISAVKHAPLTQSDALRIVSELRLRCLITVEARSAWGPATEPFGAWLRVFWTYETSPYIAERLAHGQRATKRHCQDMEGRAREIEGLLGPTLLLGDIKRSNLTDLGLQLKSKGLAAGTINVTIQEIAALYKTPKGSDF